MIYGYVKPSASKQYAERQIRNIKRQYPNAHIVQEVPSSEERPTWNKLSSCLAPGDIIIFDSVFKMANSSDEGCEEYQKLYALGIDLVFLREPQINTDVYRKVLQTYALTSGNNTAAISHTIEEQLLLLAIEQLKITFNQAKEHNEELRQLTVQGLEAARINGKSLGRPKGHTVTEKELRSKQLMQQRAKTFGGDLCDTDCIKILGISRKTYYRYKNELLSVNE